MKQSEFNIKETTWADERIEAYVDGELTPDKKALFEQMLAQSSGHEVQMASRIRKGLRKLPAPACPPHVAEAVLLQVRRDTGRQPLWWSEPDVWRRWWDTALKPVVAMSVLTLLVAVAALVERPPQQARAGSPDVQQALAEAKWALGLVSRTGVQAGSSVRDNVVRPIQQALESAPGAAAESNQN